MVDEKLRFDEFKLQRVADGQLPPQGDGVLIFDEVKVVCRWMWNSRCQKIVGLAMSSDDLASLQDIYQLIDSEAKAQQTSYIMQLLWRYLTSGFDVVGPYFTSSKNFENKTINFCLACWRLFEPFTFMDSKRVCWCVMLPVQTSQHTKLHAVIVEHLVWCLILLTHIRSVLSFNTPLTLQESCSG